MNAKQRRQDRRAWKYQVTFYEDDTRAWHEYLNMWAWCEKQFGNTNPNWREAHGHVGTRWQFKRPQDAVLFKLRWAGV